jgi:hypothetical protein
VMSLIDGRSAYTGRAPSERPSLTSTGVSTTRGTWSRPGFASIGSAAATA